MVAGEARSAFFMTEPAEEGGAGSDPSMMKTTCRLDGDHWVINGRKAFITGAQGAKVGIIMAKSEDGARSEEHTSELQSLMRISYAVFCLKKKNTAHQPTISNRLHHHRTTQ